MNRYSISKSHNTNSFRRGANNVKAINVASKPQRGGYRI